jgi:two-component system, response regulator PdtaR
MKRTLRIAVADDEPDIRDYFQMILPRLGHEVVCVATNGRELVEQCRQTQPDLVITDVRMPGLSGLDAAAEITAERPVPVILVTAHHDTDQRSGVPAEYVSACLVKPIKQADLPPMIAQVMHHFEQKQSVACE